METISIVCIVIAVICLILIWFISIYNRFQANIIRINEVEADIDNVLRKRFDLLNKSIAIIKKKLFGAEFSGIVTKFKWNIWGNNNVNGLSTPNGDHLDDKNKSKNYYENDSSTNQMSTQRRLGLIKTKKTENPIINNYLSRSISLFT